MSSQYDPGLYDRGWSEEDWSRLLHQLVEDGYLGPHAWRDITSLVLGHLNLPQVGTSLASSEGFQRKYGKGNTLRPVIDWLYSRSGTCTDCGTRLELQADHIAPRAEFADPYDVDYVENMELRCRRDNVIRRTSHLYGGTTHLTAESALMWILLVVRPRTFRDFVRLCRLYGMTMSDIRMQEAWAMTHWLRRSGFPAFQTAEDSEVGYDLLLWPDGAVTRRPVGEHMDGDPEGPLYDNVRSVDFFGFVSRTLEDGTLKYYEYPVEFIPLSSYNLGARSRNDLALIYIAPDKNKGRPRKLLPLPPRNQRLLASMMRNPEQTFRLRFTERAGRTPRQKSVEFKDIRRGGLKLPTRDPDLASFRIEAF